METKRERENDNRGFTRLIYRAYIRDGRTLHMGESVLLACLLHAKGKNRDSQDMRDVQKIMRDRNTN
jgi:hypothetical protein